MYVVIKFIQLLFCANFVVLYDEWIPRFFSGRYIDMPLANATFLPVELANVAFSIDIKQFVAFCFIACLICCAFSIVQLFIPFATRSQKLYKSM